MGTRIASLPTLDLREDRSSRVARRRLTWAACFYSCMLAAWLLQAPGLAAKQKAPITKTVSGIVTDHAETEISGAQVTIKDLQTGKTMSIYTDAKGQYRFAGLDPHHDYEIKAADRGVDSESRQLSSVDTRTKLVINLTIPPPKS